MERFLEKQQRHSEEERRLRQETEAKISKVMAELYKEKGRTLRAQLAQGRAEAHLED